VGAGGRRAHRRGQTPGDGDAEQNRDEPYVEISSIVGLDHGFRHEERWVEDRGHEHPDQKPEADGYPCSYEYGDPSVGIIGERGGGVRHDVTLGAMVGLALSPRPAAPSRKLPRRSWKILIRGTYLHEADSSLPAESTAVASKTERAALFLSTNARLLERLRFSFLFQGGPPEPIVAVLRGYQTADGGFGNALEPDLRGPESEPVPIWTALGIYDEVGWLTPPIAGPILRCLDGMSSPKGGVPFVLHDAIKYPHAPWWGTKPGKQPASLNPTAGICGLFHKNRINDPWLDRASDWCWSQIEQLEEVGPYEARVVLQFLDLVPDRRRAATVLNRVRAPLLRKDVVDLTLKAKGHVHRPVDLSPEPEGLSRSLFEGAVLERNLDAIEKDQLPDGGWTVNFPIWTPITKFEWRGVQTVEMLKILKANGRLPS
jgi:hypothetical protein